MDIFLRTELPPRILTARLLLREVGLSDISDMLLWWLNDPDTTQYLEIRHVPQTRDRVEDYVRRRLAEPASPHFGVYDTGGTRLVGTVTVNLLNLYHKTADISFVIGHPEAAGQGYATEAVHAVCWYLFYTVGLVKLTGGLYKTNTGSRRVFEKNGFICESVKRSQFLTREGIRMDGLQYGLLVSEYRPNNCWLGGSDVNILARES